MSIYRALTVGYAIETASVRLTACAGGVRCEWIHTGDAVQGEYTAIRALLARCGESLATCTFVWVVR